MESPEAETSGAKLLLNQIGDAINHMHLKLVFNSDLSKCKAVPKFEDFRKDSDFGLAQKLISTGTYYTDLSTQDVFLQKERYGQKTLIYSNLDKVKWTLVDSTRFLKGYNCKKAIATYSTGKGKFNVGGHTITAWYTEEIPIGIGPLDYGNLPGVILELTTIEFNYQIDSIKLNKPIYERLEMPKKENLISEQSYKKDLRAALGRQ